MCIAPSGLIASIYWLHTMCQTVRILYKAAHWIFITTLWDGTIIILSFFSDEKDGPTCSYWWVSKIWTWAFNYTHVTLPILLLPTVIFYHLRDCLRVGMGDQGRVGILGSPAHTPSSYHQTSAQNPSRGQLKGKRRQECQAIIWLIRATTLFWVAWARQSFSNSLLTLFRIST